MQISLPRILAEIPDKPTPKQSRKTLKRFFFVLPIVFCVAGCGTQSVDNLRWSKYYMDGHDYSDIESWHDAEIQFSRAASLAAGFGKQDPRLVWTLYDLGAVFFLQGKFEQARNSFDQAVQVCRRDFGANNIEEARCQNDLAKALTELGKYADAETAAKKSADIYCQNMGKGDRYLGAALLTLGIVYYRQGRLHEAEHAYREALAADEKALGPNDLVVGKVVHNLADVLQDQHRFAEAQALYQRDLAIKQRLLGANSREMAIGLNSLAALKMELNDLTAAETLYKQAADIFSSKGDRKNLGHALANLSSVYLVQKKTDLAYETCKKGVSATEAVLQPNHPELSHGYGQLSDICCMAGKFGEAELNLGKMIAIAKQQNNMNEARALAETRVQVALQAHANERALSYLKELVDMEHYLPASDQMKQQHLQQYAQLSGSTHK